MLHVAALLLIVAAAAADECRVFVAPPAGAPPANLTCAARAALVDATPVLLAEAPLTQMLAVWGLVVMHDIGLEPASAQWFDVGPPVPTNCSQVNGTRNWATPALDASFLYGSDWATTSALRSGIRGKLRVAPTGELERTCPGVARYAGASALPEDMPCTGDPRAAETLQLLSVHALFVGLHNRICDAIRALEPQLRDDDLFTHARAVVMAVVQRITVDEWLPALGVPSLGAPSAGDPETLLLTPLALQPLFLRALGPRVLYSDQNQELSEIPLADGFFAPAEVHRVLGGAEGACTVATGLLREPLRRLGGPAPPLAPAFVRACEVSDVAGVARAADVLGVTSLAQITRNPARLAALRAAYAPLNDTQIAGAIDAATALALEDHGPGDADVLGPLARGLLVQQMRLTLRWDAQTSAHLGARQRHLVAQATLAGVLTDGCAFLDSLSEPATGGSFAPWSVSDVKIIEETNSNLDGANLASQIAVAVIFGVATLAIIALLAYVFSRYSPAPSGRGARDD